MTEVVVKSRSKKGGGNGFQALGLSDAVYRGIVRMGFRTPTPVQRKALPVILSGVDTCVMARTGSGKTCAFLLPLLELLLTAKSKSSPHGGGVRAIILSPTRELSQQTLRVLYKLTAEATTTTAGGGDGRIRAVGIHGAESMEKQFDLLSQRPDVIVATPGRLAHHLTEITDLQLDHCQMCILDEADRLLEMGFGLQIRQIARRLPPDQSCQKVLLSATMPRVLVEFTKSGFATDPAIVRLDQEATVSDELRIAFVTCRSLDKDAALLHVLQYIRESQQQQQQSTKNSSTTGLTLIFAATRHHVEYITTLLNASGTPATLIYGTLDQEARQQNLAAFRSGRTPVLVVTDVAARGIDVPLIDHVIHYHFPPQPKLFVHRSGRAARAGRIGYCWGLVEPDELPYLMDLHLFLGRRPTAMSDDNDNNNSNTISPYTLNEMTPDMVHYGSLPESVVAEEVEHVQRILHAELSGSRDAQALRALQTVCRNAMKQYRKTRTEASREGVRRAKAVLEGGERGGAIPPHPLLRERELRRHAARNNGGGGVDDLDNWQKRDEFLRAMAAFRPKETVFEAFATGKSKEAGVVSHIDRGRTTQNKNKNDSSAALSAMKSMRRQMRMARDKGSTLVVAGTASAREINGEDDDDDDDGANSVGDDHRGEMGENNDNHDDDAGEEAEPRQSRQNAPPPPPKVVEANKRRMSKAERRRLKKNPHQPAPATSSSSAPPPPKKAKQRDFRDPAFFIENELNSEGAQRSRMIEAAMQPSASSAARGSMGNALRIEETVLDLVGDEREDLVQKQRMVRWDKSKRKYVQTTVGDELKGESKTKKLRLESGQLVKGSKLKLGELYQKWQKKTNRSIGRTGVFDDAPPTNTGTLHKKNKQRGGKRSSEDGGGKSSETKSPAEIKKEREKKQNMKVKNMKKGDRRHMEQKQRSGGGGRQGSSDGKSKPFKKR